MNDPGQAPITVRLFGEDLPLRLTRRGLRRAEFESRIPLFGRPGAEHFWSGMEAALTPFHVVVLTYAALCHLNRFTFEEIDEAMEENKYEEYVAAIAKCIARDFPAPRVEDSPLSAEEKEVPFVESGTTG